MSRVRGQVNTEGLALRRERPGRLRRLARYANIGTPGRGDALRARADEIESSAEVQRMFVHRDQDGHLRAIAESWGLSGGAWVDVDASGAMTPVPAEWIAWHAGRLDALRRASREGGAELAVQVAAEWARKEPR